MPDLNPLEDEAGLYVMGGLAADERADFEARLAQSTELRALVRELESGLTALALTAPRRNPPAKVWGRIEKAVAKETNWRTATREFQPGWWRNGWAAAAACFLGWLIYALWMNHTGANMASMNTGSEPATQPQTAFTNASMGETHVVPRPSLTAAINPEPPATARETEALRRQIAGLKAQVTQMSQSLTQQQTLLAESNRIKFLQLGATSADGQAAAMGQLSPALQRALFIGMARELGWLPATNPSTGDDATGGLVTSNGQWNVDFVDLRPGANGAGNTSPQKPVVENTTANPSAPAAPETAPAGTIPAFISGQNLILAIDSTIAAKGSYLSFSTGSVTEGQQSLGNAMVGDNAVVVTIPVASLSGGVANSSTLNVNATSPSGSSTNLQFSIPAVQSNP